MKLWNPSTRAASIVFAVTLVVSACSQFMPIVEEAVRVICRVTQSRDAGVSVSIERVYPDGATESLDATVIETY